MAYHHGVRIQENPTSLTAPIIGTAAFQVAVGISPVNLAEDPYGSTNKVKIAYSLAEASAAVGYSERLHLKSEHQRNICKVFRCTDRADQRAGSKEA